MFEILVILRGADNDQRLRGILPDDRNDFFRIGFDIAPGGGAVRFVADLIDHIRAVFVLQRQLIKELLRFFDSPAAHTPSIAQSA